MGPRALVGGHLVNPATQAWTRLPEPPWSRETTSQTVLANAETIVVWGGAAHEINLADGFLLRVG